MTDNPFPHLQVLSETPKPRLPRASGSALEEQFALLLSVTDLPPPVREHRFHPVRRWRLDFAWLEQRVAVEIDGLVHGGKARHQTVEGILGDCEKYEAALVLGYRVYRVPGPWIDERPGAVIRTLRGLLCL